QFVRPKDSDDQFQRPSVSYIGDLEQLRKDPFLSVLNVAGEVDAVLPDVEKSSRAFVESLQSGPAKIPIQINVDCRKCEYRFVPGGDAKRSDWNKEGFRDCWGSLADEDPSILDYYHVSS